MVVKTVGKLFYKIKEEFDIYSYLIRQQGKVGMREFKRELNGTIKRRLAKVKTSLTMIEQ